MLSPQAYNYNDHGISEQWMQTFVGKTSAEAGDGNKNSNSTSTSNGSLTDNGSGPALSDEASRTQVRGEATHEDEHEDGT